MPANADSLLARAAVVLETARDVRTQTQQVVDTARLRRLERELVSKLGQIERVVTRRPRNRS
jgi:hypothetical protein